MPALLEGWRCLQQGNIRRGFDARAIGHHFGRTLWHQAAQHIACCRVRRGTQPEWNLEDLLQVVASGSMLALGQRFAAGCMSCAAQQAWKAPGQRVRHPARIDSDHNHEEWKCEQQVHRLEYFHHQLFGATIQVIDVEHDAVDAVFRAAFLISQALQLRQFEVLLGDHFRNVLEVTTYHGGQAEVLTVVLAFRALSHEVGKHAGWRGGGERLFDLL